MRDNGTLRLFLAIVPPDGLNREIARLQGRLQRIVTGNIRWVKPEGLHLTLKFFGDVSAMAVEQISTAGKQAADADAPFTLSLCGLGTFPSAKRPRVVYLEMEGDTKRLTVFQAKLEKKLAEMGFPGEERPFLPHLTLARIKTLAEPESLLRELSASSAYEARQFTASELCLFKSDLGPGGALYTKLAAYPFAGSAGESLAI
ncbi:MAG: RNA 2',3'-cyclic phosphodiesterase [Syntrophobacterales bacterium]|nr:RNA 2',3'-cyclic phosphodiesterase [Syntrophobacterales bacterium]